MLRSLDPATKLEPSGPLGVSVSALVSGLAVWRGYAGHRLPLILATLTTAATTNISNNNVNVKTGGTMNLNASLGLGSTAGHVDRLLAALADLP